MKKKVLISKEKVNFPDLVLGKNIKIRTYMLIFTTRSLVHKTHAWLGAGRDHRLLTCLPSYSPLTL